VAGPPGKAAKDAPALARALLSAPDTATGTPSPSLPTVRSAAVNLTDGEVRVLAHAIDHHRAVAIDYITRNGGLSSRVVDNLELSGGSLLGWCRLRDDQRWFNLGRITAVEAVAEA
jgi:predicted DNA-binding transcriptional regulator YafY